RPIHLSLGALNNAERSGVPARSSGIDRNGRRQVLAGPRDGVAESQRPIRFLQVAFPDSSTGLHGPGANLMHTAMVGNEYEVVFRIQRYSVRVREQSVFALEKPDRRIFGFGRLLECYHCAVVLHREQKFLALLIHGYAKGSVGGVELTFGTYIPLGLTRK